MAPRATPPFRADHVGSLLRPAALLRARDDNSSDLREIENEAIRAAVRIQEELGLRLATDGEFRRASWHMDFIYQLAGVTRVPEERITVHFHGADGDLDAVFSGMHVDGKLGIEETIFGDDFAFLRDTVSTAVPKLTIPSPSMVHYRGGRASIDSSVYPDLDSFWTDLTAAYREEVRRLGELGCTYLQLDDTSLAYLNDPEQREYVASIGGDPDTQHVEYIRHMNESLAGRPEGMAVTTHMCRGNYKSSWVAEGGYDFVAEALFNELEVDGFFMEWDDERSGGFEPLRFLPKGKAVVLGLVTTKRGELEAKDELKRRIEEAAQFTDVDQLCLSPQCGFSSTVDGNALSVDEQAAKLRLIVEVADEVWGVNVREATFELFRRRGLTTMFANPGSTEVPFLTGLPDDLRFVLGLHEGTVVGMASGYAIGRGEPALVLLHTTAGLGTAVSGLATARVNRAPLVVVVGQQDRRHLAYEPFLAGRLAGLAGEYPVSVEQPAAAQDVPAAIERAYHSAATRRGPALVIVPMGDWEEPADEEREPAAAGGPLYRAEAPPPEAVEALAAFLADATAPALVVGAAADDPETWAALVDLAQRLCAPVYQEPFGARAGFPQDHPLYQGVLPADRPRLRETLAPYDRVLVVGAPVFRQTVYQPGPLAPETRIAVVVDDADEAHRSPADLTVLASPAPVVAALAQRVPQREDEAPPARPLPPDPGPAEPLTASHVLAALAERLPRNAVVLEEAPVDRPDIHARLPAREPLGYLSAAQGGLGFAMPAAAGVKMALPERPVVAIVGDGSALYGVHAAWSAVHYGVGPLWIVLSNGGYVVMDRLAEKHGGGEGPWPGFGNVELAAITRGFGCEARRLTTHDELVAALDEVVPTLATRTEPLLLDVVVAPTETFAP